MNTQDVLSESHEVETVGLETRAEGKETKSETPEDIVFSRKNRGRALTDHQEFSVGPCYFSVVDLRRVDAAVLCSQS